MKKLLLLALVAAAAIYLGRQPDEVSPVIAEPTATAEWQNGTQVAGEGTVSRILGDDSVGDRHQRFILTLDSGRTLLIAHNIDIAPRIESLREGDTVSCTGRTMIRRGNMRPAGCDIAGGPINKGAAFIP